MAQLRDLPRVYRKIGFKRFLHKLWKEVQSDNCFTLASALAYSWLFAIFPFFIFLLSLLPYLPASWKDSATTQLTGLVYEQLGQKNAPILLDNLKGFLSQPKGNLLSLGLLVTIWAASGGMAMTMTALDAAYDSDRSRPFYKQRPLAILLTIVIASLLMCVVVLVPIGTIITAIAAKYGVKWLAYFGMQPDLLPTILISWEVIRFTLALLLLLLALAILHRWGTAAKTKFQLFSPGAIFSIVVWFLLGTAFRFYIDKFGKYEKTYGTVGGVAILLLFFYIDALVLLTGAEINGAIDHELNVDSATDPDKPNDDGRNANQEPRLNSPLP